MSDKAAAPKERDIPLGEHADVLAELYATAIGADAVAQAAVSAAQQAQQRWRDNAEFFRRLHKLGDEDKAHFDFKRKVLHVGAQTPG